MIWASIQGNPAFIIVKIVANVAGWVVIGQDVLLKCIT
jgi:hypothetical protein